MRTRSSSLVAVLVVGAGIVSAAGMFSGAGAVGVVFAVGGTAAQTPALERIGSVPVAAPVNALAAGDGHLFVGTGSTLQVIDVSRPASPEPVGAYDFEQPVLALGAAGDAVYVANSHDGLRRLDLSDASAPVLTGTSATRGQAVGVAMAGARVFVSDNSLGFDIVDTAGDVQRVGEYLSDGFPRGIAAAGSRVLVADQPAGLLVVDVSDPSAPAVIGNLSFGRDPITQVFAPAARSTGGASPAVAAIVSGRGGLQAVDISDPTAPAATAPIPLAGRPAGAAMWDRFVYAASGDVLQAFDLTDSGRPVLVGQSDLGGRAGAVAVDGEHVFAATPDEVVIFRRD
jgi:hypothetical protein